MGSTWKYPRVSHSRFMGEAAAARGRQHASCTATGRMRGSSSSWEGYSIAVRPVSDKPPPPLLLLLLPLLLPLLLLPLLLLSLLLLAPSAESSPRHRSTQANKCNQKTNSRHLSCKTHNTYIHIE